MKIKKLASLFIFISTLCSINNVYAGELPLSKYYELKGDPVLEVYLHGIYDGVSYTNASVKEPFYCEPPNLPLQMDTVKVILKNQIAEWEKVKKKTKNNGDPPIVVLLLIGLSKTFPCNK